MARASIATLLSLDRWASILGINPAHFNGAYSDISMALTEACQEIWFQHAWQATDRVSREDVAAAIMEAEADIAKVLGYWPAPKWMVEEVHQYPQFYRPDYGTYGMIGSSGKPITLRADYGRVIAPGRRAVTRIALASSVAYTDADLDGAMDTATITCATTATNIGEVKVYWAGHGGAPEWEIRQPRTKTLAAGTFTATYWVWQLLDPDLWEALLPAGGLTAIDFMLVTVPPIYDNLVATVDVYREFNDVTDVSATVYWEPTADSASCGCSGSGCSACLLTTQDGCVHVSDSRNGLLAPAIAEYTLADDTWTSLAPAVSRDPDFVKISYYAGELDDAYKSGTAWEPLSNWWAQTIAYLAAARLEKPVCDCQYVSRKVNELQRDLSFSNADGAYGMDPGLLRNPFGTRYGEVYAWRRVSSLAQKRAKVAIL